MRKALLAGVAGWVVMAAAPALADVDVFATIDKTKDVTVTETIDIFKQVDLEAFVTIVTDKAAESHALLNQRNQRNEACTNCAEKVAELVNGTGNDNSGILTINNVAGNMNNQGNAIAVSVDFAGQRPGNGVPPNGQATGTFGFAEAQAAASQYNGGVPDPNATNGGAPSSEDGNLIDAQNLIFRDALISDSLNNNSGVVAVNNSAGNLNNQGNVLSIAFSLAPEGVALAESDLGQFNSWNRVFESDTETQDDAGNTVPLGIGINKQANITGSINGNTGVLGVNNASGNMANQANVFSVALVQTLQ
jgi:hypothetical protein